MFDVRNEGCGLKHPEERQKTNLGLAFLMQKEAPAFVDKAAKIDDQWFADSSDRNRGMLGLSHGSMGPSLSRNV
jgi:hypothetical protein